MRKQKYPVIVEFTLKNLSCRTDRATLCIVEIFC